MRKTREDKKLNLTKSWLEKEYKTQSGRQIAKKLGVHPSTLMKEMKRLNIESRPKGFNILDLSNKRFGNILVIRSTSERKRGSVKWECVCDCGNVFITSSRPLVTGHRISCGCKQKAHFKGLEDLTGKYFNTIKKGAEKRNFVFNITLEYIWNLYIQQSKKCALSNVDIVLSRCEKDKTASLDRIDSSDGYIEGNVQWVHKDVNRMKSDFKEDYFIELCQKIVKKGKLK